MKIFKFFISDVEREKFKRSSFKFPSRRSLNTGSISRGLRRGTFISRAGWIAFGGKNTICRFSAAVGILSLALLPFSASALLTMQDLYSLQSSPRVLGVSAYQGITLTSAANTSLKLTATPLFFNGTAWTYEIDWTRTRQAQGSVYVNRHVVASPASPTGSADVLLSPSRSTVVDFYSSPGGNGVLLLQKHFTTLAASAAAPSISITSPAGGENWAIGSAQQINWTAPAAVANVQIAVNYYGGCSVGGAGIIKCSGQLPAPVVIAQSAPDTGSYSWNIDSTVFSAGTYTVTVSDAGSSGLAATSNSFNLTPFECPFNGDCAPGPILPTSTPVTAAPIISSLSPASGPTGTSVTITGSGFTPTGNTVNFGGSVIPNVVSSNGTSLTFTVPGYLVPACSLNIPACPFAYIPIIPNQYQVSIINANGTSNTETFTVTSALASAPVISYLSPTSSPVNTTVTITGSSFTPTNNTISFGGMSLPLEYASGDGQTLQFIVPADLLPNCSVGAVACPQFVRVVAPGPYNVFVANANGTSTPAVFTVTSSCPYNALCAIPGPSLLK